MPVMRVSDETWKRLQQWAVPLEDSPEDALRRILAAAEAQRAGHSPADSPTSKPPASPPEPSRRTRRRSARGQKFPQSAYREPILAALRELGGQASMGKALDNVFRQVETQLGPADLEQLPSGGDIRWRNTAAWERFKMVQEGLLRDDSPRGSWELTDEGRAEAERTQS